MKKTLIAAALACFVATPAFAEPTTFTFDPQHTFPHFSYDHFGMTNQHLRFDKATGSVTLDQEAKKADVDVVIDMKSISTGFEAFDSGIQKEDFFNTKKYPEATFKSTKVNFDGDKPTSIEGDLTIKGITKPITLEISSFTRKEHPLLKKDTIGVEASGKLKRSDFDAGKFVPLVGDEVTLNIVVEAMAEE